MNIQHLPIVSIIVPVFNADKTIHIALNAIKEQSYSNLEVIIIDDCSTDQSLDVINRILCSPNDKAGLEIKIVSLPQNGGVASARNIGLNLATGKYIYYVDADDHIEPYTILDLVQAAEKDNAEIVGCNWYLTFNKNERKMNQPSFSNPLDAIKMMLNGTMRWNLWLFLVKRSLYEENNIRFTPGKNMGEDIMIMIKLFVMAEKVSYINEALYHYGQSNEQSLTKLYSNQHVIEVTDNIKEVEKTLKNSKYSIDISKEIDFLKLNIKLPLLISDKSENYHLWSKWFEESNPQIMKNKSQPFRTRLLQLLAYKRQFWAVRLYYMLVIRFLYGVIYK